MAAVDTSTLIAFIQGDRGADVRRFEACILASDVVLPPLVLTELLSEPHLPARHRGVILELPVLEISDGFWFRAAATRSSLLASRLRARLPDTLIAQSCLDNDVPLITRDTAFRHFARHCDLRLA
jgi:predicted nucleic acid-binding protein